MEAALLCIIAASGLCGVFSLPDRRQYHFVYELKNWTEALSYCRENHTDLATIDSLRDMNTLNKLVNTSRMKYSYGYAWVGLYLGMKIWTWSMSGRHFPIQNGTQFTNWASGEPTDKAGQENCGHMYDTGLWKDGNCAAGLTAICSDVRGANVTYTFINISMTWLEAQSYCRANHTDLASVTNVVENQKVQQLIPSGQKSWIGLYVEWKWADGSDSSFRYWNTEGKEPNNVGNHEDCVSANFAVSGLWEDWNCDYRRAFICYSELPVSTKVTVRLKVVKQSSADLNDPAVMEEMLQQLKQKLKQQGGNGDISLSWRKQSDGHVFHKDEKDAKKKTHEL